MKKMILFSVVAITAMVFVSCSKDDDPAPTTAQRIQKKWDFEKDLYHEVSPGFPEYRDTTIGIPGEYADFRTDNKVYSYIDGDADTVYYSIISDSKIIIDGDTATIQVLNDTQFQLYAKSGSATDYYEYSIYFKK